jgi:hypothetical protein
MRQYKKNEIPILLITFNRPDCLQQAIENLAKLKPTKVFIFSDGPRKNRFGDYGRVKKCRDIIDNQLKWKCVVKKKYRRKNLGCGLAMCSAITWFFKHNKYGIILEDDCIVSQSFFSFCAVLLKRYYRDNTVAGISADFKFIQNKLPANHYGFISFPQIWGWATWRRVWRKYKYTLSEKDLIGASWLDRFADREKKYWIKNISKIINKTIDTWDYQFSYLVLKNDLKFIFPMRNMVTNIGFGSAATHTKNICDSTSNLKRFEVKGPFIQKKNYKKYDNYLKSNYFIYRSLQSKIFHEINKRLKSIFRENDINNINI